MNSDLLHRAALLAAAMALAGCASWTPADNPAEARLQLLSRYPELQTLTEDQEAAVAHLLQQPLTPQTAAQLMLLNSPRIEMLLAQLGIANARRAQAELITNPHFAVGALRPEGGGRWQLDLGLSQSLLDLLTRSMRITLAETTLIQRQLELQLALDEALHELQSAYFAAIAAQETSALQLQQQEAGELAAVLAQRMRSAGNLPSPRVLHHQLAAQQTMQAVRRAQLTADTARLRLNYLLGLKPEQSFKLPDRLPDIPQESFAKAELLNTAQARRPDVLLVRRQQELLTRQRPIITRSRWADVTAGIKMEREFDGSINAGPEVEFGVPLFDRGHARLAELNSEAAAAQAQETHLLQKIEHDISLALRQLNEARHSHQQALALREIAREQLQETQREVNFMLASPFDLIELKQQQIRLEVDRIDALQRYWQARAALALAVGKNLPLAEPASASPLPATPHTGHGHHHGEHHHD